MRRPGRGESDEGMTETPRIFNRRRLLRYAAATGTATALIPNQAFAWPRLHPHPSPAPRTLSAAGRVRSVEAPGFPVHHLGVSWSGPDQAGALRLRYPDGWGDWRPVFATESADRGRHSNLSFVGDAQAYEFEPAEGVTALRARHQHRGRPIDSYQE